MSKTLIKLPANKPSPQWEQFEQEDGLFVLKIQVDPEYVGSILNPKQTVLFTGTYYFLVLKAQRIPGAPDAPPAQPFKVWCELQ